MKIDLALKKKIKKLIIDEIAREGREMVDIETPFPMTDNQKQLLLSRLPQFSNFTITNSVNRALIGGFVIRYQSTVYDNSVKSKIEKVSQKLLETTHAKL